MDPSYNNPWLNPVCLYTIVLHVAVDIRAKGTEEGTREYVLDGMKRVQEASQRRM